MFDGSPIINPSFVVRSSEAYLPNDVLMPPMSLTKGKYSIA